MFNGVLVSWDFTPVVTLQALYVYINDLFYLSIIEALQDPEGLGVVNLSLSIEEVYLYNRLKNFL